MNLQELKTILNSGLADEIIEYKIIDVLAKDENVISTILMIIERERNFKKEIQTEMNLLLSKAHVGLENKKFNSGDFIQKEIVAFYTKYKGYVGHCFKKLF